MSMKPAEDRRNLAVLQRRQGQQTRTSWWLAVLMSEVGTPADATSLALGKNEAHRQRAAARSSLALHHAAGRRRLRERPLLQPAGDQHDDVHPGLVTLPPRPLLDRLRHPAFDSALGTQNVGLFEVPGDRYLPQLQIDDSAPIPQSFEPKAAAWA